VPTASRAFEGAIVQRVDRPSPSVHVFSLRLPGRSVELAIVCAREAVAMGEIARAPSKRGTHADAETMRWRKQLEGARVISLAHRTDRPWFRLTLVRAGEQRAVVASREGAAMLLDVGALPIETDGAITIVAADEEPALAQQAELAVVRALAAVRDDRKRTLVSAIERVAQRIGKRIEAIEGDLKKIGEADALTARGTLLAGHAHAIPRGAREAIVEDWSTGEARRVTIALDPAKSAREQAEALFHRAKRLKRGATIAQARRDEAVLARDALRELAAAARAAETDDALDAVEKRSKAAGVAGARVSLTKKGATPAERLPYTSYRSGEHPILVGRSAADNDALTTKVARPHDLWLHAKGITGAHVIVPLDKRETCPIDVLVDAAHLAAHFSDAKGETVVDVVHTPRRYVRKPRGAAPGAVAIDREKVIVLRVEPARIARLLATADR
jgi:predicted ribosome quality control (RQC) complex YloA/Tae2 family protein